MKEFLVGLILGIIAGMVYMIEIGCKIWNTPIGN